MKKLVHKGHPRHANSICLPDYTFACWDAVYNYKYPMVSRVWGGVTCPRCLRRQVWGKKGKK